VKLLTKTTLYYITVSLFIFFICGIGIYQLVINLEERKVKEELIDQMHRFSLDLKKIDTDFRNTTIISGGLIELKHVHEADNQAVQFTDTLIFDEVRKRVTPYKKISFFLNIKGAFYKISIYKSMIESNYLIEQVALTVTIIVIVFLLAVYFLYRYFFGRIWADFFATINKIQHFDLSSPEKLRFPNSMIIEFNELNQVLEKMINKISSDFEGLRDFSGNLTHEVQTPLAVIKSKAGLLLQDENVTENQMILASEINHETSKISRLIKALSIFTKLDHHQYHSKEKIDLQEVVRSKIIVFEDFIEAKQLEVKIELKEIPPIEMNPELAEILFTNLVKNAVRHNIDKGKIEISCIKKRFEIKNTGIQLNLAPEKLFERFSKASRNSESLGIGLSIAKKICDYYGFEISYKNMNENHLISINFNR
jgi:signal transduction histidine kinase